MDITPGYLYRVYLGMGHQHLEIRDPADQSVTMRREMGPGQVTSMATRSHPSSTMDIFDTNEGAIWLDAGRNGYRGLEMPIINRAGVSRKSCNRSMHL